MGSYASEPKVDKESQDESNDKLNCGASSMQGWRVSQEDAHNCLLNFDTDTSFFAVYDGHGGHDVAQYCSQKLPDFIKNTEAYKGGDVEKALIDGFLGFDKLLTEPDVIAVLKEIAGVEDDADVSDDEENVNNLYEEATMPIEKVIEKYTSCLANPAIKNLKKNEKAPKSPYLKAKKENEASDDGVSSASSSDVKVEKSEDAGSSSSNISSNSVSSSSSSQEEHLVKTVESANGSDEKSNNVEHKIPEIKVTSDDGVEEMENEATPQKQEEEKKVTQNGDVAQEKVTSSDVQENGDVTPKGKGKAKIRHITPVPVRVSPRTKASPNQLYKKLLDFGGSEDEDSEDEEDVTFEGAQENSSDDDEENVTNSHLEEGTEDSSEEEEEDDLDDEDDDDDEDMMEFTRNMKDEPGSDSGCTAVVALLRDKKLWVANAGDSRCVVCRNGKAIEMSFDHKPEDEPERDRIVKAGGRVTMDGRVNNGLNLSRAIGDHAYKQNTELGPREQMITALPDVKTLELNDEDEFLFLACDGIWNFMSSQEVVDFISSRLKENKDKLSAICEELFDHCLAPNTMGDGTGCDNMTAILVHFKPSKKRSASPDKSESDSNKRVKTDDGEPQSVV